MIEKFDLQKILKKALKNGGDYADIYAEDAELLQIIAEQKKLEKVSPVLDRGVGIRVLWNDKTAYGYTNDVSEEALLELAESVAQAVKGQAFDKTISLKEIPPHIQFEIRKRPQELDLERKRAMLSRAEKVAWAADPRIKQVKALYSEIRKKIAIANSLGDLSQDDRIYSLFFVQVVAEENGVLQTGYHPEGGLVGLELFDEWTPEKIA